MELFTYLMAKNDHNTSVKKDLFSYLLGKNQSGTYTDYSGTSLSINNTKKAKMKVNLLGNTSQTGTPTPDNPIPVNVVSGDNEVVVCGKNLFVKSSVIDGEKYLQDGSISSDSSYCRSPLYMNVNGVTKLTISGSDSSSNGKVIIYDENKNVIDYWSTRNITITLPNNSYYIRISVEKAYKNTLQVEVGDTATSYSDESSTYPIHLGEYELCKIGTYQDKFIRNSGKQLFNGIMELGILDGDTGQPVSNSSYMRCKDFIPVKELTDYSIKSIDITNINLAVYEYKEDYSYNLSSNKIIYNGNTLLTTNSGTKFIKFRPLVANTNLSSRFMVNEGSTALPYEPYGNGDWYLEKHIGKYTFNGSETWTLALSGTNTNLYYSQLTYISADVLSDYFTRNDNLYLEDVEGMRGVENNDRMWFRISNTTASDSTAFKTWLSTHNTSVYYVLETPTYTKITYQPLIDQLNAVWRANSYKGQTNISQINNDLPFELNVSVKVGS